jgi:hypothetical protein
MPTDNTVFSVRPVFIGWITYINPFSALGFGNVSASSVSVRDVENSDAVFEKIRNLVDERS